MIKARGVTYEEVSIYRHSDLGDFENTIAEVKKMNGPVLHSSAQK